MADKPERMSEKPTPLASPHTVTSASVGTALTQGAGTITAFTMNQPATAQTDDLTPLTLVDPVASAVASAATASVGTGTAGTGVYSVNGGVGAPATLNITSAAGGISAINSVVSGGQYTTFPPSPATLTFVSGTGSLTGSTVTLTPAAPSPLVGYRTIYSANMAALKCELEPRPNVPMTPGITAPTWPKSILPAGVVPAFNNGCWVTSCPANMTFTVTC